MTPFLSNTGKPHNQPAPAVVLPDPRSSTSQSNSTRVSDVFTCCPPARCSAKAKIAAQPSGYSSQAESGLYSSSGTFPAGYLPLSIPSTRHIPSSPATYGTSKSSHTATRVWYNPFVHLRQRCYSCGWQFFGEPARCTTVIPPPAFSGCLPGCFAGTSCLLEQVD